jgi:hypothetical protein
MAFQASLVSLVSQQLTQLLTQVCHDYHLDAAEVLPRYLEATQLPAPPKAPKAPKAPRQPKVPKEDRPPCAGQVKGCPCKHKAQPNDTLCHIHIKQRDNPKASPAPKRICTGTTSKGAPCTVKAQDGCDLCHLHLAKANQPPKVVKKPRKSQAPQVEGRGESPPPVFCQPCLEPQAPQNPPNPEEEVADLDDQMEDLQKRLASIMMGAGPPAEAYQPSREALESEGFEDDPEEFDEEQMESPHSQASLHRMKVFDGAMETEEFLEE